jgi:hypothetical protein
MLSCEQTDIEVAGAMLSVMVGLTESVILMVLDPIPHSFSTSAMIVWGPALNNGVNDNPVTGGMPYGGTGEGGSRYQFSLPGISVPKQLSTFMLNVYVFPAQ